MKKILFLLLSAISLMEAHAQFSSSYDQYILYRLDHYETDGIRTSAPTQDCTTLFYVHNGIISENNFIDDIYKNFENAKERARRGRIENGGHWVYIYSDEASTNQQHVYINDRNDCALAFSSDFSTMVKWDTRFENGLVRFYKRISIEDLNLKKKIRAPQFMND